MTVKLNLKNIKDKLKDNSLDLSLCELKEVPVREIVSNKSLCTNFYIDKTNFVINLISSKYGQLQDHYKV